MSGRKCLWSITLLHGVFTYAVPLCAVQLGLTHKSHPNSKVKHLQLKTILGCVTSKNNDTSRKMHRAHLIKQVSLSVAQAQEQVLSMLVPPLEMKCGFLRIDFNKMTFTMYEEIKFSSQFSQNVMNYLFSSIAGKVYGMVQRTIHDENLAIHES